MRTGVLVCMHMCKCRHEIVHYVFTGTYILDLYTYLNIYMWKEVYIIYICMGVYIYIYIYMHL